MWRSVLMLALGLAMLAIAAPGGAQEVRTPAQAPREMYPTCVTHERWCVQVIALRFVEVLPGPEIGTRISYERIVFGVDFLDEKTAKVYARRILREGVCHMLEGNLVEECIPAHLVQSVVTGFVQ